MTVETTSFLSSAKIANNGSEKSAKVFKNHKNLIIILLVIVLVMFCVGASVLQICIFKRMNGMQQEIDQLKSQFDYFKKTNIFEDEIFDDLQDFSRKYNQNDVGDEMDLDDSISISNDKTKFDDVGEEDSSEISDESDDNYEEIHSGYGDSYEDDELYDLEGDIEDKLSELQKDYGDDENNIYKDMTRIRKTRSVVGVTNQGVPVLEEPYTTHRNPTKSSSATINSLQNRDEKKSRVKFTWDNNRRIFNGPRRQYHRQYNRMHNVRHHHNNDNSRRRFAFAAAPIQHTFTDFGRKLNDTTSTSVPSAPIQSRSSRVMHVEDKSKAFRQVVRKDQLHKLQEARRAPEQWNPSYFSQRRRTVNPMRRNLELKNGKRMKITAVHFEGDSSSLALGRHHEYQGTEGNNKVKLNKNEYIHWQPAEWTNEHGMDRYFSMDPLGVLTVKDHGLFLIYAQVFYSDDHDVNGYVIEVNNRVRYQCTTMTHTTSRVTKINSCYTSGLIHLRHGDKIQLRDIGNHRSVLLEPSKSFFGLIKINLVAPTPEGSEVETFTTEKK